MIMEFKIEKSHPLPPLTKYPFAEMEIGDSFVVKDNESRTKQSSISTCARVWAHSKSNGFKFTVRQVEEGIRIWRKE